MRMPDTASKEVIIIGGGVIGASVAYHLSQWGCREVLVLDGAPQPGMGSTGRATGGFRCQFSTPINVRLSLLSRQKLLRFHEEIGIDSGYRPCGYLFVASTEVQLALLRDALDAQRTAGLTESHEVSVDDIRQLNPALYTDDLIGGTFCPLDGFTRPMNILQGYLQAAARNGVEFCYGVGTVQVWREGDRAVGVQVGGEHIAAGVVVNAAGAWAGVVAQQAGVNLPVRPVKRQVAITVPTTLLPETMPMSIDVSDGFHLRVRDGRVLLLLPDEHPASDPFDLSFDEAWLPKVLRRAHYRVPCLKEIPIDREACYAGLYEMSPDRHAIVGEAPELRGFYLVNGSSGHGVMHAPALGEIVAALILGQPLPFDITPLRPTRFAEGDLNPETGVL
ncbi:MAG: FAD-binding oxidoreductase [Armatimonadota bacterium]